MTDGEQITADDKRRSAYAEEVVNVVCRTLDILTEGGDKGCRRRGLIFKHWQHALPFYGGCNEIF